MDDISHSATCIHQKEIYHKILLDLYQCFFCGESSGDFDKVSTFKLDDWTSEEMYNAPARYQSSALCLGLFREKKIALLKINCSLFSQLYVSSHVIGRDLQDFFAHENQPYPPPLSQYGVLHSGTLWHQVWKSYQIAKKEDLV